MSELPEHLLFLILIWIPVKSLLRFKSVCKSWYAIIESSNFINHHLHNNCSSSSSFSSSSIIFKHKFDWKLRTLSKYICLSGDKFENLAHPEFLTKEFGWYKSSVLIHKLRLANSCNGIICLHLGDNVTLWNPATKQIRTLPLPPRSPLPSSSKFLIHPLLGLDVRTKDYKVAMIIQAMDEPGLYKPDSQVEVYNLSTDSWRIIHKDILLPFQSLCYYNPKVVYGNGICFGTGSIPSKEYEWNHHWVLISFDFTTEVIRTTPMPMPDTWDTYCSHALDFLDENIVLITSRHTEYKYDVWVLHGYGVSESWSKQYTFEPTLPNVFPLMFSKNRDFLVLVTQEVKLLLYNLVTQEMQDLHVSFSHGEFVFYNESLVSIKGLNGAADRETCLLQFVDTCEDDYESEKEEERDESEEETECQEDRKIKRNLEFEIQYEVYVGWRRELAD